MMGSMYIIISLFSLRRLISQNARRDGAARHKFANACDFKPKLQSQTDEFVLLHVFFSALSD